jgi:hypothetical protein
VGSSSFSVYMAPLGIPVDPDVKSTARTVVAGGGRMGSSVWSVAPLGIPVDPDVKSTARAAVAGGGARVGSSVWWSGIFKLRPYSHNARKSISWLPLVIL